MEAFVPKPKNHEFNLNSGVEKRFLRLETAILLASSRNGLGRGSRVTPPTFPLVACLNYCTVSVNCCVCVKLPEVPVTVSV